MELNIDSRKRQVVDEYGLDMGYWDLCFWQNCKCQIDNIKHTDYFVKNRAKILLNELYSKRIEDFGIKYENNQNLDRIHAQIVRKCVIPPCKQAVAKWLAEDNYRQYIKTVELLRNIDAEDTYKYLVLNDVLNRIIKVSSVGNENKVRVHKRIDHISTDKILCMDKSALDYIYNNAEDMAKQGVGFAELYMKAMECGKGVLLGEKNTHKQLGQWLHFASKRDDKDNYNANVQRLKHLALHTPWCTVGIADIHLEMGEYYVFVDEFGYPHLAAYVKRGELLELRGVDINQEIETEYRGEALQFLDKFSQLRNVDNWQDKETRNSRLLEYIDKINRQEFGTSDVMRMLDDMALQEYSLRGACNSIYTGLLEKCKNIKPILAEYYGCAEEEVYIGDYEIWNKNCPYKVIFGDVSAGAGVRELHNLEVIVGNFHLFCSEVENVYDLKYVTKDVFMQLTKCNAMPNLEIVCGNLRAKCSRVSDLGNLRYVRCGLDMENALISNLDNLENVGGDMILTGVDLVQLPKLRKVGLSLDVEYSMIESMDSLEYVGRDFKLEASRIKCLPQLKKVGRSMFLERTSIKSMPKLVEVGNNLECVNCEMQSLPELRRVGVALNLVHSKIVDLPKLEFVGQKIYTNNLQMIKKIRHSHNTKNLDTKKGLRAMCGMIGRKVLVQKKENEVQNIEENIRIN